MKMNVRRKEDDTGELTSMFSPETIESIGRGMDEIDVNDSSGQYTLEEAKIELMKRCVFYDPDIR